MQEQLQKQMAEMSVEGSAGGGMVSVKMNGLKHVLGIKIEPEAVSSGDVEMLQDLIVAAINEAARKVDDEPQAAHVRLAVVPDPAPSRRCPE